MTLIKPRWLEGAVAVSSEKPTEQKIPLNENQYKLLINHWNNDTIHSFSRNDFYYDDPDMSLLYNSLSCRIRELEGNYSLKFREDSNRIKYDLSREEIEDLKNSKFLKISPSVFSNARLENLDFTLVGSLVSTRSMAFGGDVCIDRNIFDSKRHEFDLRIKKSSDTNLHNKIRKILNFYEIPIKNSITCSRYQRLAMHKGLM
jgi:uncharacterized protein YjbK